MPDARAGDAPNPHFVKIGSDVFPVYGDDTFGWSIDPHDLDIRKLKDCRYGNLAELLFALMNLNLTRVGKA